MEISRKWKEEVLILIHSYNCNNYVLHVTVSVYNKRYHLKSAFMFLGQQSNVPILIRGYLSEVEEIRPIYPENP